MEADIDNSTPDATKAPDALGAGVSSMNEGGSKTRSPGGKGKKPAATKRKKKEKELEFVTPTDFLGGKRLFYTGGDMQYASQSTKKKMELVRSSTTMAGFLVPAYDPKLVTHLITDAAELALPASKISFVRSFGR